MSNQRIANVTLDEKSIVRWSPDIDHERKVAIFDLIDQNQFAPKSGAEGPFDLHLSLSENRLVMEIRTMKGEPVETLTVSLRSFRRIIKDYFQICESYFSAIRTAPPSQIESIDMGRRAVHNEGTELLLKHLERKADVDFDTARRLFTLMCVLTLRERGRD